MRHLLSDQRDPMSRQPLTPDMLVPEPALLAEIRAWVAEQRAKKRAADDAGTPQPMQT